MVWLVVLSFAFLLSLCLLVVEYARNRRRKSIMEILRHPAIPTAVAFAALFSATLLAVLYAPIWEADFWTELNPLPFILGAIFLIALRVMSSIRDVAKRSETNKSLFEAISRMSLTTELLNWAVLILLLLVALTTDGFSAL